MQPTHPHTLPALVDDLTTRIAESAFRDCRMRRRGEPVSVNDLEARMLSIWIDFRDLIIERWAADLETICQMSGSALEDLMVEIDDALLRRVSGAHGSAELAEVLWEPPLWETGSADELTDLEHQQVTYAACGIACLWWTAHEGSDIAPTLHHTQDELEAWLQERKLQESRIVRVRTRSGGEIAQFAMWEVGR